jgi:hypothetical protein
MRTQVKTVAPETALERVLESLEAELLEASDEEILQAAKDLGQNPLMKGSIAFIGITFPSRIKPEDVFDLEALKRLRGALPQEPIEGESDEPPPGKGPGRKRRN